MGRRRGIDKEKLQNKKCNASNCITSPQTDLASGQTPVKYDNGAKDWGCLVERRLHDGGLSQSCLGLPGWGYQLRVGSAAPNRRE
jgi:hypothetical protein